MKNGGMMNPFMKRAVNEALRGVRRGDGGPFGAVVVRKGKVIAVGHNTVIQTNDPTCHAEMNAIREAAKKLKRFDLSDCELYTSCEPCPMCFSAIHWAKMKTLYFGCTKHDAEKIGFDDAFIYAAIQGTAKHQQVKAHSLDRTDCLVPFKAWEKKANKVRY
jgi:guanine deaminase